MAEHEPDKLLAARLVRLAELAAGLPDVLREEHPMLDVAHVGAAVLQMANLPLESNVQFMTIMATKMPFVGRG